MTEQDLTHIIDENPQDPFAELDLIIALRQILQDIPAYDLMLLWEVGVCQTPITELAEMAGISRQRLHKQLTKIKTHIREEMTA